MSTENGSTSSHVNCPSGKVVLKKEAQHSTGFQFEQTLLAPFIRLHQRPQGPGPSHQQTFPSATGPATEEPKSFHTVSSSGVLFSRWWQEFGNKGEWEKEEVGEALHCRILAGGGSGGTEIHPVVRGCHACKLRRSRPLNGKASSSTCSSDSARGRDGPRGLRVCIHATSPALASPKSQKGTVVSRAWINLTPQDGREGAVHGGPPGTGSRQEPGGRESRAERRGRCPRPQVRKEKLQLCPGIWWKDPCLGAQVTHSDCRIPLICIGTQSAFCGGVASPSAASPGPSRETQPSAQNRH